MEARYAQTHSEKLEAGIGILPGGSAYDERAHDKRDALSAAFGRVRAGNPPCGNRVAGSNVLP